MVKRIAMSMVEGLVAALSGAGGGAPPEPVPLSDGQLEQVVEHLGLGPLAGVNPTGSAGSSTYLRGDGAWAPVSPEAISKRFGWVVASSNNPAAILGLDGVGFATFAFQLNEGSVAQISFTTDGGATWSSWVALGYHTGMFAFDRIEGSVRRLSVETPSATIDGAGSANGIRIRAQASHSGTPTRISMISACGLE